MSQFSRKDLAVECPAPVLGGGPLDERLGEWRYSSAPRSDWCYTSWIGFLKRRQSSCRLGVSGHQGAPPFSEVLSTIARIAIFSDRFNVGHFSATRRNSRKSGDECGDNVSPKSLRVSGDAVLSIPTAGAIFPLYLKDRGELDITDVCKRMKRDAGGCIPICPSI